MGAGNVFGMPHYRNKVVSLKWCSHNQHIGAGLLHRMTISARRYVHFCGLPFGLSIFHYRSLFALPLTASPSIPMFFLFVAFSLSIRAAFSVFLRKFPFCCLLPCFASSVSSPSFATVCFALLLASQPPAPLRLSLLISAFYLSLLISLSSVNYRQQKSKVGLKRFV